MRKISVLAVAVLLCAALSAVVFAGRAEAFTPWRTIIKAGKDERKAMDIRDDRVLGREVESALKHDGGLDGTDIHVSVYMGHACLVGTVSSEDQVKTARDAAAGTHGVRSVNVYLPLKSRVSASSVSAADLKGALAADPAVVTSRYKVRAVGSTAVVMGIAGSEAEKRQALKDISRVDGVSKVVDFVQMPEPEYEKRIRQRFGILR